MCLDPNQFGTNTLRTRQETWYQPGCTVRAHWHLRAVTVWPTLLSTSARAATTHQPYDYCKTSAKIIFGDTVGDPLADEILRALRSCLITGMARTDLYQQFKHAHRAVAIGAALSRLLQLGRVRCDRPRFRWWKTERCWGQQV